MRNFLSYHREEYNENLTLSFRPLPTPSLLYLAHTHRDFEKIACDILQRWYEIDREKAEIALKREILEYDNCTVMQAALLANDMNFIAHPCFQNVLTKIWYSKIEPDVSWLSVRITDHFTIVINYFYFIKKHVYLIGLKP